MCAVGGIIVDLWIAWRYSFQQLCRCTDIVYHYVIIDQNV